MRPDGSFTEEIGLCTYAGKFEADPRGINAFTSTLTLGARAAEGFGAKIGPSDGIVFDNFAAEYLDIWQEIGEK